MAKKRKALVVTLVSVIVILSLALGASITYNFIGGFYRSRVERYNTVLGEDLLINIDKEGSYCVACNFSGTVLLGVDIGQNVYIKVGDISSPLNLRAKAFVSGNTQKNCDMFGFTNWLVDENDSYIYFNQTVDSNEQIGMCKYVRLNQNLKLESNLDYILIIVVEAYA
ncbi:MAG: hypothetical protein IJ318_00845 [Clostridia bacterium]|nr:hypothetical protein [Clostridia bacterium]